VIFTISCSSPTIDNSKIELTISAASSLKDALEEIEEVYEHQNEVELHLNFGASGTLSKQIEQGAPVDLFFSADDENFTYLVKKNLIHKQEAIHLLKNELVLIAPIESKLASLEELNKADKVAIGIPETVPAGKYAKEALINLDIWKQIEGNIIYAKDVRQVLSYVETGNVSAGVVYKTDTSTTDKVKTVSTFHSSFHSPIVYPVGVIQTTKHKGEVLDFYQFLQSKQAMNVFKKYGFTAID
jgi:molybdate transport system substrate-binding protein